MDMYVWKQYILQIQFMKLTFKSSKHSFFQLRNECVRSGKDHIRFQFRYFQPIFKRNVLELMYSLNCLNLKYKVFYSEHVKEECTLVRQWQMRNKQKKTIQTSWDWAGTSSAQAWIGLYFSFLVSNRWTRNITG